MGDVWESDGVVVETWESSTEPGVTFSTVIREGDIVAGGSGVDLSDATPAALGTAAPGVSTEASRADHVHEMPAVLTGGGDPWGAGSPERIGMGFTGDHVAEANPTAGTPGEREWNHTLREPGNVVYDPVTEQWICVFTGRDYESTVGAALSTDGVTWTEHPDNPICPLIPWHEYGNSLNSEDPYLAKNADDGTLYRDSSGRALIFVEEKDGSTHNGVGLWRSTPNTLNGWTYFGRVLGEWNGTSYAGLPGTWDATDRPSPTVFHDGTRLVLLYEGRRIVGGNVEFVGVGLAFSDDEGESFTAQPDPILERGPAGTWTDVDLVIDDVIKVEDRWFLVGHGYGSVEASYAIGRWWTVDAPADWTDQSFTELVGNPFTFDTDTLCFWGNDPTQGVRVVVDPYGSAIERVVVGPGYALAAGLVTATNTATEAAGDVTALTGDVTALTGDVTALDARVDALEAEPNATLFTAKIAPRISVDAFDFDTGDFGGLPPASGSSLSFPDAVIVAPPTPWSGVPAVLALAESPAAATSSHRLVGLKVRLSVDLVDPVDILAVVQVLHPDFSPVNGRVLGGGSSWAVSEPSLLATTNDSGAVNEHELVLLLDEFVDNPAAGAYFVAAGFIEEGGIPGVGTLTSGEMTLRSLEWIWDTDEIAVDASQITTGTVAQARLGTGSAGAGALFLADDQTWKSAGGSETLPVSIVDAKGDLIVGTAADTATRLAVGSSGQQVLANPSAATGLEWAVPPIQTNAFHDVLLPLPVTSTYSNASTASHALRAVFYPVWIPKETTCVTLCTKVTTGESGATARLGIYKCSEVSTFSFSGSLIVDAGLINAATPGDKSITINQILAPGMYVFAVWCSNHSTVRYGLPYHAGVALLGTSPGYLTMYLGSRKETVDYSAGLPSTIPPGQTHITAGVSAYATIWGTK